MTRVLAAAIALAISGCAPTLVTRGPYPAGTQIYSSPNTAPVTLVVTSRISSSRRQLSDSSVSYVAVASDVIVGGEVRIRAGTPVETTITRRRSGGGGKPGAVRIDLVGVQNASGELVQLWADPLARRGRHKTGAAVGLGIGMMAVMGPFAWFFFGMNGHEAEIAEGTTFLARAAI